MATKTQLRVHIRWMIRRDMTDVLSIENFLDVPAWTDEEYYRVLRQRNVIGMVAEIGEKVVGSIVYELFRDRIHLIRMGVDAAYRRSGIGRAMIDRIIGKLMPDRRWQITAEVPDICTELHLLLREMQFRAEAVKNGNLYQFRYKIPLDDRLPFADVPNVERS